MASAAGGICTSVVAGVSVDDSGSASVTTLAIASRFLRSAASIALRRSTARAATPIEDVVLHVRHIALYFRSMPCSVGSPHDLQCRVSNSTNAILPPQVLVTGTSPKLHNLSGHPHLASAAIA